MKLEQKLIDKIEEITLTDYDIIDCEVTIDKCLSIIEDLIIEYENLLDEYNDYKEYIRDNFEFKEMR